MLIPLYSFAFGEYTNEFNARCGLLSSTAIPGLHVEAIENWQHRKFGEEPFRIVSGPTSHSLKRAGSRDGIRWNSLVFAPILELEPFPITFNEFMAWTGDTRFESFDGRIAVGTLDGTRTIFGQLLMTFGLVEAVKLMPPVFWMKAINERIQQLAQQEIIRQKMWRTARQAAQLLHDRFNFRKIAVAGDLVSDAPFGVWSRTILIFPDREKGSDYSAIYQALRDEVEGKVDTYYCSDYVPLEVRNTFSRMVFI